MASGAQSSATRSSPPRSSIACCIIRRRSTSAEKVTGWKERRKAGLLPAPEPRQTEPSGAAWRSRQAESSDMSFWRHGQIYPSDGLRLKTQGVAVSGSAPTLIVLMSLQPAIPWRVALPQSPPPLHRPVSIFHRKRPVNTAFPSGVPFAHSSSSLLAREEDANSTKH